MRAFQSAIDHIAAGKDIGGVDLWRWDLGGGEVLYFSDRGIPAGITFDGRAYEQLIPEGKSPAVKTRCGPKQEGFKIPLINGDGRIAEIQERKSLVGTRIQKVTHIHQTAGVIEIPENRVGAWREDTAAPNGEYWIGPDGKRDGPLAFAVVEDDSDDKNGDVVNLVCKFGFALEWNRKAGRRHTRTCQAQFADGRYCPYDPPQGIGNPRKEHFGLAAGGTAAELHTAPAAVSQVQAGWLLFRPKYGAVGTVQSVSPHPTSPLKSVIAVDQFEMGPPAARVPAPAPEDGEQFWCGPPFESCGKFAGHCAERGMFADRNGRLDLRFFTGMAETANTSAPANLSSNRPSVDQQFGSQLQSSSEDLDGKIVPVVYGGPYWIHDPLMLDGSDQEDFFWFLLFPCVGSVQALDLRSFRFEGRPFDDGAAQGVWDSGILVGGIAETDLDKVADAAGQAFRDALDRPIGTAGLLTAEQQRLAAGSRMMLSVNAAPGQVTETGEELAWVHGGRVYLDAYGGRFKRLKDGTLQVAGTRNEGAAPLFWDGQGNGSSRAGVVTLAGRIQKDAPVTGKGTAIKILLGKRCAVWDSTLEHGRSEGRTTARPTVSISIYDWLQSLEGDQRAEADLDLEAFEKAHQINAERIANTQSETQVVRGDVWNGPLEHPSVGGREIHAIMDASAFARMEGLSSGTLRIFQGAGNPVQVRELEGVRLISAGGTGISTKVKGIDDGGTGGPPEILIGVVLTVTEPFGDPKPARGDGWQFEGLISAGLVARHAANGAITADKERGEVLKSMTDCMGGDFCISRGRIRVFARRPPTPELWAEIFSRPVLTDHGPSRNVYKSAWKKPKARKRAYKVEFEFPELAAESRTRRYSVENPELVERLRKEFGEQSVEKPTLTLSLPLVESHGRAKRLAHNKLDRLDGLPQPYRMGDLSLEVFGPLAWQFREGDIIPISLRNRPRYLRFLEVTGFDDNTVNKALTNILGTPWYPFLDRDDVEDSGQRRIHRDPRGDSGQTGFEPIDPEEVFPQKVVDVQGQLAQAFEVLARVDEEGADA